MKQSVLVNGINVSWKNLQFVVLNVALLSITKIDYDTDMEVKDNYGYGDQPTSRGFGNQKYAGSITLLTDEVRQLNLVAPQNSILRIPPFTASCIFDGIGGNFVGVDTLSNISFTKDPFSASQGSTGIYCTLPFIFAGLKHG